MKNSNQKTEMLKPLIFNKKINLKHKIIPLDIIYNTIGPIRAFPTATKEWFNSVYAYNQNSIKNLSVADKTLSRLVKSYFNFYFNKKVLKSSKIATRFRRLSLTKILISKAELKHTSSKVTVTLYTYNAEKSFLTLKLKNLIKAYFTSKYKNINPSLINILHDINLYKKGVSLINYLEDLKSILKLNIDLKVDPKTESYLERINEMIILSKKDKTANKKLGKIYIESLRKIFLGKEIKEIATCKLLLNLNKSKFEDEFIMKLKRIIGKIYNKEVEFNIVNLKTLYFNSDIFTEVIATKLKNRKNNLLSVLKSSLYLVKLPTVNKIREKYGKVDKFCLDHLKNLRVNSVINKYNTDKDTLDQLLLDILPSSTFISGDCANTPLTAYNENYINSYNPLDIVFNSLKNKDMAGVRLEAKGRLTKRFTASRSVFKVKWKGSIKNLDSSYKKLSTVILRGHAKSNVQYTLINSKTRNGAFGLKGWISSK
jgi:ribosomal VAR1-like protein